jgi:hypothetical protein
VQHFQSCLGSARRQIALHNQPVPTLHYSRPHEAHHRTRSEKLLAEPCVRIDDRSMGRIRTLLFFEVDLSIAAAKFPEGYLTSLGFGLGELCSGVRRRRWRGMSVP